MERTEAGLVVPDGTSVALKKSTKWDYNDYKMVRRAQKTMHPHDVEVILYCRKCEEQIVSTPNGLECKCTNRELA